MKIINTKVTDEAAEALFKLCKSRGLTYYELLQGVIDSLIRYTSEHYNLSADMQELMHVFDKMESWKNAFHLCDPSAEPEIVGAIYLIQAKGKKGIKPIYVKGKTDFFGQWDTEINLQKILEEVFCICAPTVYKSLRNIGVELGTGSILETILRFISMYGTEADEAMYRAMFEDANRSEFGRKPHEGTPFKRKLKRNIEDQAGLTIHFSPDDAPETTEDY